MKDIYVNIPEEISSALVPAAHQPDYLNLELTADGADLSMGVELLRCGLAGHAGSLAAIHAESGRAYTFAFIDEQSTQLALRLVASGLSVGARVGLRSRNVPEALIAICGIWKAGGVIVPIPYSSTLKEMMYFIGDTGTKLVLMDSLNSLAPPDMEALRLAGIRTYEFSEKVKRGLATEVLHDAPVSAECSLPVIKADQLAIIWHTGGTTGLPKGCYHTHRRFFMAGRSFGQSAGVQPGERWSASAPIGHALGFIYHTIYTVMHAATAVFVEDYANPATLLRALDHCKVEVFTGMMLTWAKLDRLIVDERGGKFPGTLRHGYAMWQTASAEDVRQRWAQRGIALMNNYGSTSFATWVIIPRRGSPGPAGCLGRPAEGYQIECVEVRDGKVTALPRNTIGRLAVKGPSGLTYWNRQDFQQRDIVDGWTLCDDLIRVDSDGFVHYLGRSDFMISSAGHKIAPAEVEAVLSRFNSVKEVAVVPAPCKERYEQVVAFIVTESEQSHDEFIDRLDAFVRTELPSHKVPRIYRMVDELPKDSVGKIRTKAIREWAVQLAS